MSWRRAGRRDMSAVLDLLLRDEALHVPFTSRIRSGARGCEIYMDATETGDVRECILLTAGGLLLPALGPHEDGRAELGCLIRDLRPTVHSVMGAGAGVRAIESLLPLESTTRVEYFLMTLDADSRNPVLPSPDGSVTVRRAYDADAEALFPLQRGYELEEVVIDPVHFSETQCMKSLRIALRDELVFVAERSGAPVAKAATNARGFGADQIGGVYTLPGERGKGIGRTVVMGLLHAVFTEKETACLFVKKRNRPAIALYEHLGFSPITDYVITYYGL
jgi:GNAT superfamily N-acetyltransferase